MSKWHIDHSEWWPVLTPCREGQGLGEAYEIPDAEIADLRRVLSEFRAWQQKLQALSGEEQRPHDTMGGELENLE